MMNHTDTTLVDRFRAAGEEVRSLLEDAAPGRAARRPAGLPTAAALLAALPLTRAEYAQLTNMLTDAGRLLADGQIGAARWTLTQLARKIARGERA